MSVYATDHASAYADVLAAGGAITFTKTTTAQDDTTGAPVVPVVTTVSGVAIRVKGDPVLYRELGLTESEAPTLFFIPATQGDLPALDSAAPWGSEPYRVRNVNPLDVDGAGAIAARLVIVR